jgi:hypothetical protein
MIEIMRLPDRNAKPASRAGFASLITMDVRIHKISDHENSAAKDFLL